MTLDVAFTLTRTAAVEGDEAGGFDAVGRAFALEEAVGADSVIKYSFLLRGDRSLFFVRRNRHFQFEEFADKIRRGAVLQE